MKSSSLTRFAIPIAAAASVICPFVPGLTALSYPTRLKFHSLRIVTTCDSVNRHCFISTSGEISCQRGPAIAVYRKAKHTAQCRARWPLPNEKNVFGQKPLQDAH
jgi:hypothetical protein